MYCGAFILFLPIRLEYQYVSPIIKLGCILKQLLITYSYFIYDISQVHSTHGDNLAQSTTYSNHLWILQLLVFLIVFFRFFTSTSCVDFYCINGLIINDSWLLESNFSRFSFWSLQEKSAHLFWQMMTIDILLYDTTICNSLPFSFVIGFHVSYPWTTEQQGRLEVRAWPIVFRKLDGTVIGRLFSES